jgi:transcriptional regulator with XRE-family HTH domain
MLAGWRIFGGMAMDCPLRRWRRSRGMTQADVAQAIGVKPDTISRYEQGSRRPLGEALIKLLELTGLPANALLLPGRFIAEHPDFLEAWASELPRRGRPPRQRRK